MYNKTLYIFWVIGLLFFQEVSALDYKECVDDETNKKYTCPNISLEFKKEKYICGDQLEASVEIETEDSHLIVEESWRIGTNLSKTYDSLQELSKDLYPGYIPISLRVREQTKGWSEWEESYVLMDLNYPPMITELTTNKDLYAQGEGIEFDYKYKNEKFEPIIAERWVYREINELETQKIIQKPKAIYHEGKYCVTLELQDASGQWSKKVEKVITITQHKKASEFDVLFKEAEQGTIITNFNNKNYMKYKNVKVKEEEEEGLLIMSNSPEIVTEEGILYEEYLSGKGRVMFHHINEMQKSTDKKLMVILENENNAPVDVWIENKTIKGPSEDVLFAGQQLLHDYLSKATTEHIFLAEEETEILYDSGSNNWLSKDVITGMFDFEVNEPIKMMVLAIDKNKTIEDLQQLTYLEKDIHPRGTFNTLNKNINLTIEENARPQKILIGKKSKEWLKGKDAITGKKAFNRGNFGVKHEITVTAEEDTAIILNPRGNLYKGAVKWEEDQVFKTPQTGYFLDKKRATLIGIVKKGESRSFTYVLPNGSSAPVLIGFIPEQYWDES